MKAVKVTGSVDEYIRNAPEAVRPKLKQLRAAFTELAPRATEKISYGMPYYGYKGRVGYFAYFKDHISLFAVPPVIEEHKDKLAGYKTSKGTIQFPLDEDLPMDLIKELIRFRVELNEKAADK